MTAQSIVEGTARFAPYGDEVDVFVKERVDIGDKHFVVQKPGQSLSVEQCQQINDLLQRSTPSTSDE